MHVTHCVIQSKWMALHIDCVVGITNYKNSIANSAIAILLNNDCELKVCNEYKDNKIIMGII